MDEATKTRIALELLQIAAKYRLTQDEFNGAFNAACRMAVLSMPENKEGE